MVIEHLAGVGITSSPFTDYERALECAERPNTFLKVPGLGEICPRPPRLNPHFHFEDVPPLFEMAKEAFGVRRMMWGSDFPPSAGREGYANTLAGVLEHPAFADGDDKGGSWGGPPPVSGDSTRAGERLQGVRLKANPSGMRPRPRLLSPIGDRHEAGARVCAHERVKLREEQFPAVEFTTDFGQHQRRLFGRICVHHIYVRAFPCQVGAGRSQ